MPMFSTRLPASLVPTPLAAAIAARRSRRDPIIDLTLSNPTTAALAYPETLAAAWSNVDTLRYEPDPRGLRSARDAVAGWYAATGEDVSPDRLVLTASTSEAYSHLFKLLCDPGDRVLVPCPSYPLFEHLAHLDAVGVDRYTWRDAGRWVLDEADLAAHITPRTRAIVVVAPNNPTGSVPTEREWHALADACRRHGLALIVDEVFAAYPLRPDSRFPIPGSRFPTPDSALPIRDSRFPVPRSPVPDCVPPVPVSRFPVPDSVPPVPVSRFPVPGFRPSTESDVLTFRLNGLSKLVGLPQVKLGWILVSGPEGRATAALDALDVIADTYLSVSTAVQVALPTLLSDGAAVHGQILDRITVNLAHLTTRLSGTPLDVRMPDGGWSVVLRVPIVGEADDLALAMLDRGVLVHPGYFYDLPHDGYIVLSLLVPEPDLRQGLDVLCTLPSLQLT